MGRYSELMDGLKDRAERMGQRARALNGGLGAEIERLSSKPMLGPDESERLKGLEELRATARMAKRGQILKEAGRLVNRLGKAEKKLSALDAEIDECVLSLYSTISSESRLPEEECQRLEALFVQWKNNREECESCRASLERLFDALDRSLSVCDAMVAVAPASASTASEAGDGKRQSDIPLPDMSSFPPEELNDLRYLLMGIMGQYVYFHSNKEELKPCCTRVVASHLAALKTPVPIAWHDKAGIRKALQRMQNRLSRQKLGWESLPDLGLFRLAMRAGRAATSALPPGTFFDEVQAMQDLVSQTYGNGRSKELNVSVALEILVWSSGEVALRDMVINDALVSAKFAISYGRLPVFFLDVAPSYLKTQEFGVGTPLLVEERLAAESQTSAVLKMVERITPPTTFYSERQVRSILERFGLGSLMGLVHPSNFVLETETLTQLHLMPISEKNTMAELARAAGRK